MYSSPTNRIKTQPALGALVFQLWNRCWEERHGLSLQERHGDRSESTPYEPLGCHQPRDFYLGALEQDESMFFSSEIKPRGPLACLASWVPALDHRGREPLTGRDAKPRQGAGTSPGWAREERRARPGDPKGRSQPPARGDLRRLPGAFINSQAKPQTSVACKRHSL